MLSTITTGAAEEISAPETIKASGQARGTFLVTVQAVATTTTKGSITATTEAPTTTEATIIITTAKPTTTGIVETYSVSSDIVTEDTTAQTTTAEVKQTAAADTIEAMTSSAVATEDPTQTNTTEAEPVTTSEAVTIDDAAETNPASRVVPMARTAFLSLFRLSLARPERSRPESLMASLRVIPKDTPAISPIPCLDQMNRQSLNQHTSNTSTPYLRVFTER